MSILSEDDIIVDESLISTDVDQLIRIISGKGKMKLSELERLSDIEKTNIEKWVRVLEDEGYINIEYGITGTYLVWAGGSVSDEEREELPGEEIGKEDYYENLYDDEHVTDNPGIESGQEDEISESDWKPYKQQDEYIPEERHTEEKNEDHPSESNEDIGEDESLSYPDDESDEPKTENLIMEDEPGNSPTIEASEENPDPESLLDEYLSKKKRVSENTAASELKQNILGNLDKDVDEGHMAEAVEKNEEVSSATGDAPVDTVHEINEDFAYSQENDGTMLGKPLKLTGNSDSMKELIDAYMTRIKDEKAKIAKLSREKEELYQDKLSSLEGRMESDLATLTEHVLKRQAKVTEMKKNVLELPDKVDELEKLQNQINNLGEESRHALSRTNTQVNDYLSKLNNSKDNVRQEIQHGREIIHDQKMKIDQLEGMSSSADETISELKVSVEKTASQIEELNSRMKGMLSELGEATEMKQKVSDISESIGEEIAKREGNLDSLETNLDDIEKTEQWVLEYLSDYEGKIIDIERYVSQSEEELASVREAAEAAYMRRYLKELDDMTEAYDSELTTTLETEEDIDSSIKGSKERLNKLVKESKNLLKKLHKKEDDLPDFEEVSRRAREKTSKAKDTVKEKANERENLKEEARRVKNSSGKKDTKSNDKD